MAELNSTSLLYLFVRSGVESTLERSTIVREHMGLLLHQLVKEGTLPAQQYYKGLVTGRTVSITFLFFLTGLFGK